MIEDIRNFLHCVGAVMLTLVLCAPFVVLGAWVYYISGTSIETRSQLVVDSAFAVVGIGFGTAIFPFQMSVPRQMQRIVLGSGLLMFVGALWSSIGFFAIWSSDFSNNIDAGLTIDDRWFLSGIRSSGLVVYLIGLLVWTGGCVLFVGCNTYAIVHRWRT